MIKWKHYTITVSGKAYLEDFKQNYQEITASANQVLFGGSYAPMGKKEKRA